MRKAYRCEHTVPPVWWFTFADRNALGEEIVVEFRKNENTHGKNHPDYYRRLNPKCQVCQNILSSSECDMCEDFDMFARVKEEMK